MITKTILFAICSLLMVSALAEPVISEHYDSAPNSSPEALQLVKRCQPERSESAYLQMVKDVEKYERAINLANPRELNQPYLVVNPKKTFCIPMSEKKFPILAQEAFDNTIEFPGMSDSETRRLRVFLAQQIALAGSVVVLVKNEKGNAIQIGYMTVAQWPNKIFYRSGFLKRGEYDESNYPMIFKTTGDTFSISLRGEIKESFKELFLDDCIKFCGEKRRISLTK